MSLGFLRARSSALPFLVALLVALPACDSSEPVGPDGPDDGQVIFGVNYDRLFAEPSAAEIQRVRDDWAGRNPSSSNETEFGSFDTAAGTAFVVEHQVSAGGSPTITHYGVVHVPTGGSDLPVLVVHHGGDNGFSISGSGANGTVAGFAEAFPDLASSAVLVFPVYRSEPLLTPGNTTLRAGGEPSPWDYDVDDSIAFLDAALELYDDETDEDRVAAIGFSRGGNTAALHSIRDDRVDALVDYYGPTDFYNEVVEVLTTGLLTGDARALLLPGGPFLLETVLNPLRNANGTANPDADYATARLEVVRRSASLFEADLPDTQVHHHVNDGTVPIPFSIAFAARAEGGAGGSFEFFQYDTPRIGTFSFHSPEGFPSSVPVATDFLRSRLAVGSAVPVLEAAY